MEIIDEIKHDANFYKYKLEISEKEKNVLQDKNSKLLEEISDLKSLILEKDSEIIKLESDIEDLESDIEDLEDEISELESELEYNSGIFNKKNINLDELFIINFLEENWNKIRLEDLETLYKKKG